MKTKQTSLVARMLGPALIVAGSAWLIASLPGAGRDLGLGLGTLGDTRVAAGPFPKVLVDPAGRRIKLESPPQRIVSLVLGADEVLLPLVAPSRLAAVDHFADEPAVSTVSHLVPSNAVRIRGIDPERILMLAPDMVFVGGYTLDSAVRILQGAGVPVVRLPRCVSFADVAHNARLVAAAVGEEEREELALARMWDALAATESRVAGRPRPRVLYYSPVGYTEGAASLVNEKLERAGAHNVVVETGLEGSVHVGEEVLIALDPEVIVVPRWSPAQTDVRDVLASPAWRNVRAVREGRVHGVDVKWLTSVAPDGARGVEELARLFHPAAFAS